MNTTRRIAQAETFLNLLYKKITAKHFSYLMTFSNGYPTTYPFAISDKTQLAEMAKKAIELSDNGSDIWHAVNPVSASPTSGKRGDETAVSYQIAIVVDIDIRSDAHKSDNLATNFDEAKSFLPFTPSLIIDSGYDFTPTTSSILRLKSRIKTARSSNAAIISLSMLFAKKLTARKSTALGICRVFCALPAHTIINSAEKMPRFVTLSKSTRLDFPLPNSTLN